MVAPSPSFCAIITGVAAAAADGPAPPPPLPRLLFFLVVEKDEDARGIVAVQRFALPPRLPSLPRLPETNDVMKPAGRKCNARPEVMSKKARTSG